MKNIVYILLLLMLSARAQSAYQADVQSVDAIIQALYGVISGGPGVTRNWERFRFLFAPDARLIPTIKNQQGQFTLRSLSPEQYIELFSSRVPTGFYERELHRVSEQFGTVTHLFSTYETRDTADGPVTNRGINSIQLFYDGNRYYIVTVYWCAESMGFTLPEKYLKQDKKGKK